MPDVAPVAAQLEVAIDVHRNACIDMHACVRKESWTYLSWLWPYSKQAALSVWLTSAQLGCTRFCACLSNISGPRHLVTMRGTSGQRLTCLTGQGQEAECLPIQDGC